MKGFLLDTSVASMLAPGRPDLTQELSTWVSQMDLKIFMSTITVVEIEQGIARLMRLGSERRAASLSLWLDELTFSIGGNILLPSVEIAMAAGRLADGSIAIGRHPGLADILIAATAKVHGLTLLTRNVRHFEPLSIDVIDPLVSLPG